MNYSHNSTHLPLIFNIKKCSEFISNIHKTHIALASISLLSVWFFVFFILRHPSLFPFDKTKIFSEQIFLFIKTQMKAFSEIKFRSLHRFFLNGFLWVYCITYTANLNLSYKNRSCPRNLLSKKSCQEISCPRNLA